MTTLSYIDAVREMCRTWGAQKLYMLTSTDQGWNAASLIARFRELQDAAGSGTQRVGQFQEEAHTGEGLLVARALHGAPEKVNAIVFVHYVPRGKAKQKAFHLGVSVAEYWRDLENAHYWLAAKIQVVDTAVETKKAGSVETLKPPIPIVRGNVGQGVSMPAATTMNDATPRPRRPNWA